MIKHGHVLDLAKQEPSGSVHCIVTSIPYWGLRDYNTPPQIWKNSLPLCEKHEWQRIIQPAANGLINNEMQGATLSSSSATRKPKKSNFCRRCHAWRGEYGLEPTIDLYIQHTVEIFRELRRVLRDDGTLWLNIGDSYNSIGKGGHDDTIRSRGKNLPRGSSRWGGGNGEDRSLKPKDLCLIPARVALALQADGWWVRKGMKSVRGTNKQNKMRDAGILGKETLTLGWKPTCRCKVSVCESCKKVLDSGDNTKEQVHGEGMEKAPGRTKEMRELRQGVHGSPLGQKDEDVLQTLRAEMVGKKQSSIKDLIEPRLAKVNPLFKT